MDSGLMAIIMTTITVVSLLSNLYKDTAMQKLIQQHQEEKKDLLNRIMAKNLVEYKNVSNDTLPKGSNPIKKSSVDFEGLYKE